MDHRRLDRRGPEALRLVECFVQRRRDREVDVDADEVHEPERPHRVAGGLDRGVDLIDPGFAGLEHPQRPPA